MTAERALVDLLHEALDAEDVAGPFQRLQLELEKTTGASDRRRTRRIFMTRQRLALLAAAVVVLVITSVLVGTRMINSGHTSEVPAGGNQPGINQAAVLQLLAKPLHFQALKPTDPCPASTDQYGYFGEGPAYGIVNGVAGKSSWGTYWSVTIATPLGTGGPVVARAKDLTHGSLVLDIGPLGAGSVYATDIYQGKTVNQFQAVAFDTDHMTTVNFHVDGSPFIRWDYLQGFKSGWGGGCVGVQIDAPGFSEVFYAVVPTN